VRCYTRALELLLLDEYRHKPVQKEAAPLVKWVIRIKHPQTIALSISDRNRVLRC
jgi:hypothetical protein